MSALSNAAKKAAEWTAKRDALIRRAHASGSSLRDIAVQAGMTHSGVAKILKKGE